MPAENSAAPEADLTADHLRRASASPPRWSRCSTTRGSPRRFPSRRPRCPTRSPDATSSGRAQTGSGKTLGFSLPLAAPAGRRSTAARRPRGLVLVPTRELATQVDGGAQAAGQGNAPVGDHHLRRGRLRPAGERPAAQDRHRRRHPRPARRPDRAGRVRPVRRRDHGHRRGGPDGRPRVPPHRPAAARDDARPTGSGCCSPPRSTPPSTCSPGGSSRPGAALGRRELLPGRDRAPRAHRRPAETAWRSSPRWPAATSGRWCSLGPSTARSGSPGSSPPPASPPPNCTATCGRAPVAEPRRVHLRHGPGHGRDRHRRPRHPRRRHRPGHPRRPARRAQGLRAPLGPHRPRPAPTAWWSPCRHRRRSAKSRDLMRKAGITPQAAEA